MLNPSARLRAALLPLLLLVAACGRVEAGSPTTITPGVAAGFDHTCALSADGRVSCWGANGGGQLGDGTTISWLSPHPVSMPDGVTFTHLSAGVGATCALATDGAAWCWGAAWNDPSTAEDDILLPTRVEMPADVRFAKISTSFWTTCALATDGAAWCWGSNADGSLGDGTLEDSKVPVEVRMPEGRTFTDIALGGAFVGAFACALADDGSAWCWGSAMDELGEMPGESTPVAVPMVEGGSFVSISAGDNRVCAIDTGGAAWCWGGELGTSPVEIASTVPFAAIAVGDASTCALSNDGGLWCWGSDSYILPPRIANVVGGRPDPFEIETPATTRFAAISMGSMHACAVTGDGAVWCWGYNESGQLGDGTTVERGRPESSVDLGGTPLAGPGFLTPMIIPWSGEIPIWPLSLRETSWALSDRSAYLDDLLAGGMPARCATPDPDGEGYWGDFEDCEYEYLVARVGETAGLELLISTDLTVFETWGTGPVRVAWAWSWDMFGSNGDPNVDVVFTPDGVITNLHDWIPLNEARAEAYATETFRQMNEAIPEFYGMFIDHFGGEISNLGAPVESGDGWTVTLTARLVGCHACVSPFAARFDLGFTDAGALETARFVDFCSYPLDYGWDENAAVVVIAGTIPACDQPLHENARRPSV